MPRVLISAGPTHEPIDDVRYLANRSSGRMGIAIADEAADRGWSVTLLLGPVDRNPGNADVTLCRFETAADLESLLEEHWPSHDLLIMAAAVADFRPQRSSESKMSRRDGSMTIQLEPTNDLLAAASARARPDQRIVGFALEPADRLLTSARTKLSRKQLDAIVANPLETMRADTASAHLLFKDGTVLDSPADLLKSEFARWLLNHLEARLLNVDRNMKS